MEAKRGVNKSFKNDGEVFVSGSGFGGQGRYTGFGDNGEARNKTFIIQIIPILIKYEMRIRDLRQYIKAFLEVLKHLMHWVPMMNFFLRK
jgi:hypothetical protein